MTLSTPFYGYYEIAIIITKKRKEAIFVITKFCFKFSVFFINNLKLLLDDRAEKNIGY